MKTLDDRGQIVRISGRLPWRLSINAAVRGGDTAYTKADRDRIRHAGRGVIAESLLGLLMYLPLVGIAVMWWPNPSPLWLAIVKSLFIGLTPGILGMWLIRRVSRRVNTDAATSANLCAACTHSLVGVPEDPDGCVVCPECGAAWRMTRQAR